MSTLALTIAWALSWALALYNLVSLIRHYHTRKHGVMVVPMRCLRCGQEWSLPHRWGGEPLPAAEEGLRDIRAHQQMHAEEDRRYAETHKGALQ